MLFSKPAPRIDEDPHMDWLSVEWDHLQEYALGSHQVCVREGGQILLLIHMEFPVNQNPKHMDSPGGPVAKTMLPTQVARVQPLGREWALTCRS